MATEGRRERKRARAFGHDPATLIEPTGPLATLVAFPTPDVQNDATPEERFSTHLPVYSLQAAAGYFGGWTDQAIMRTLDVLFAFPLVLLAIPLAGVLKPGVFTEIVAIMVVLVPYISRIVRTSTLSVKAQPYIEAARAGGAGQWTIILRYVLPNMISPVLIYTTTLVGLMML